uniref:Uncharacterized protein n=1 Tax=Globodera rostochiensis TaxID=31243 RepID=A0A914I1P7_GLORO
MESWNTFAKTPHTLGVSEGGKILKFDGNVYKTSNLEHIVVHLLNKDKRSQFKNAPVGHKEFVEKAKQDDRVQTLLTLYGEKARYFTRKLDFNLGSVFDHDTGRYMTYEYLV